MMKDALRHFPAPEDAPEPGTCVRVERPEAGLAVLVLDPPHRRLAVLDAPLLRDLDLALREVESDSGLRALIITGRKPLEFAAGADLEGIASMQDPIAVQEIVRWVHRLFLRLEKLPLRTVAAVGGACPGGAFELALSCDFILLAEDPKSRIGLPETQLGIIPGWGGCHRLPERIGVPAALTAILSGRLLDARSAKRKGFVDRLCWPDQLLERATDLALGRAKLAKRERGWRRLAVDRNPLVRTMISRKAKAQVLAKTHGHYPAPLTAIDLVVGAVGNSREVAEDREAAAITNLVTGSVCKSLVSLYFAGEAAKKAVRPASGERPAPIERAGVIGGGVMGGGIASLMALKSIDVRLSDLARPAVDQALAVHAAAVAKRRKRRRLKPAAADAALDRLTGTTAMDGFGRAQFVVEAVAEKLEVKQQVLRALAERVPGDCILATNTSSLSVDAIAEGVPHPERVVGMHFFNPVARMPLVEVVRGKHTDSAVVEQVAATAQRMGKTPVVVSDVPGFLINRILMSLCDEALRLFAEGLDPARMDRLMLDFGLPMGPLRLVDEVGLDIAQHTAESLHAAYGERMIPCAAVAELAGPERLGVKTGKGFYVHGKGKAQLAGDLNRFQAGSSCRELSDQAIHDRLILGMANEAARCLGEGVVASPALLDLAVVLGTGFAPFRGGILHHVEALGVAEVVRRLEAVAAAEDVRGRPGGALKFEPAAWLRAQAEGSGQIS